VSAWPHRRRAAPLHALFDRASSFVLRPPDEPPPARLSLVPPAPEDAAPDAEPLRPIAQEPLRPVVQDPLRPPAPDPLRPLPHDPLRPVVAVVGLAPRAGASTLARALAARLARLDPDGAAVLFTDDRPPCGIAGAPAARLAARLAATGCEGGRAFGRLCVVDSDEPIPPIAAERCAPLVADLGHGAAAEPALAIADHAVLACPPDIEPALAAAVETSLRAGGCGVSLVVCRAAEAPPAGLSHALAVPDSRLSAALTLACWEPRGALAYVVQELAERSLAEVIE
jgi:hypothetical protein